MNQRFETVEIPKPPPPYVMLEVLSRDKNQCKGIHVITLSNKPIIKLGRGHDSDIRITDISVSRCHAILRFEKGNFFLEDHNSKFGTLVLMKKQLVLNAENSNLAI